MPPRHRLGRDLVIDAAVALADREGVEPLTIRRLADELGSRPMSLYHHVANKDDILDAMVDRVFTEITAPPADLDWGAAMRVRCLSARRVLASHPWAVPLLESRTSPGPATLRHHEAVLACLRSGGLSWQLVAHTYAALDSYVYGFALQEATLPATAGEELAGLADRILEPLDADLYPHLRAFTAEHVMRPGYDFGVSFEVGLDLLLEGLAALAARGNAGTPTWSPTSTVAANGSL